MKRDTWVKQTDDSNVPCGYEVCDQQQWKIDFQTQKYPETLLITFNTWGAKKKNAHQKKMGVAQKKKG